MEYKRRGWMGGREGCGGGGEFRWRGFKKKSEKRGVPSLLLRRGRRHKGRARGIGLGPNAGSGTSWGGGGGGGVGRCSSTEPVALTRRLVSRGRSTAEEAGGGGLALETFMGRHD
ncbi:hypothetical protein CGRA01v4_02486 [Colletotrichum graminicola]|nr:hypothetical protein CGRA01v4_02486 [Colletotrichum graminicola]